MTDLLPTPGDYKLKRLPITLLIGALMALTLVVACNKSDSSSNASTTSGISSTSSPSEVWKAFYAAAQKKDGAAMKRLLSKDALAILQRDAKDQPLEDFITSKVGNKVSSQATAETRNEKIIGDTATVEVKGGPGGDWRPVHFIVSDDWKPIHFVKEDGLWKITH